MFRLRPILCAFWLLVAPAFAEFDPRLASVMDTNLDGVPDLVVATSSALYSFVGLGQGKFDIGQRLPGTYPTTNSFFLRDMDGDGVAELLLSSGAKQEVWKASKAGLQLIHSVGLDEIVWNSVMADLDGNKMPEIVAAAGGLVVFEKQGTSWREAYRLKPPVSSSGVWVGELNGDGCDDLVLGLTGSKKVWVVLGRPQGNPRPAAVDLGRVTSYAVLSDFNGDGKTDLAAASGSGLGLALGRGDGTFAKPSWTDLGRETLAQGSAVADLDGDGKPDYIGGEWQGQALVAYPAGAGPARVLVQTEQLCTPQVGDYDGDGKPDLILCYNLLKRVQLMRNRGDGTFEPGPILRR